MVTTFSLIAIIYVSTNQLIPICIAKVRTSNLIQQNWHSVQMWQIGVEVPEIYDCSSLLTLGGRNKPWQRMGDYKNIEEKKKTS